MPYIRMAPYQNIEITNKDGGIYFTFLEGVTYSIWDGRGDGDKTWKRFRRMVFERDNYTCQKCGSTDRTTLRCHHKKPVSRFPNLYYDIDNAETLCNPCHMKIPTR